MVRQKKVKAARGEAKRSQSELDEKMREQFELLKVQAQTYDEGKHIIALTGLLVVVGGRGDLQLFTDRLDSPATPTGFVVPVGVDEGNYLFCRRSSSAPKKVAAACKMSFARCSSKFSLRSRFSSSRSSVLRSGRVPASMSACFTHVRCDSPPTPSCRATFR
jgi:hypothetical protein